MLSKSHDGERKEVEDQDRRGERRGVRVLGQISKSLRKMRWLLERSVLGMRF